MQRDTLIIIPAYNEARDIARVLRAIHEAAPQIPVMVIDDASRDGTAAAARAAGARVISHPINMNYGAALHTGYRYAREHGIGRVVQMDADGQHDPASIAVILQALEDGADLVLGSRFRDPGSYVPPLSRRVGIKLLSLAASLAVRQWITDATTGFQGLSRRLVGFYATQGHFPHDYPDANMIIRAARAGFRVVEVPVRMHVAQRGGGLHAGLKPVWYALKMTVAVTVEASRRLPQGDV
jgi:glycosyltransferase involved in cell wall biosynthesis